MRFKYITLPSGTVLKGVANASTVVSIHDELGEVIATLEGFANYSELEEWVQYIEGLNWKLINTARQSDVCTLCKTKL